MAFLQTVSIARPKAFLLFFVLLLVLIPFVLRYRYLIKVLLKNENDIKTVKSVKSKFFYRTLFLMLSVSCFILAYAGISWGTRSVLVQKNGNAVVFVFDISFSMMAKDGFDGQTRLSESASYAKELIDNMDGVSVSVVLAKGDGTYAVPLTDDRESVYSLINNLSPYLMTSSGTSLGKGIQSAISSFPPQSSQIPHIWLFTDGEETDSGLSSALAEAVGYGISVCIIGFGSETGADIMAGDGITKVHSQLKSAELEKLVSQPSLKGMVSYVRAGDAGSAYSLLRTLGKVSFGTSFSSQENLGNAERVSYEITTVEHYNLFLFLGILFVVLGIITSELDIANKKKSFFALLGMSIVMFSMTGCSVDMKNRLKILDGSLEWNRKNYQEAIVDFLSVLEDARASGDKYMEQYALYNLATTYLMQDESEATLERFNEISGDASDDIRFAVFYNTGLIAHRKGDYERAAECFKQALIIDSSNENAKINLELSILQDSASDNESSLAPVSEAPSDQMLEQAIYSIIREQEQEKWKNEQQQDTYVGSMDY